MKSQLRLALLLVISLLALPAMAPALAGAEAIKAPVKNAVKTAAPAQPLFMWKVTGGKGTAYLVGTMHLVPPGFYPLPKDMEKAFAASQTLVLEVELKDTDQSIGQQFIANKGVYRGGDSLIKHISPETNVALTKYLSESGTPEQNVMMMKPWVLGFLVIPMQELLRRGFDPEKGIDKHFLAQARAQGKPVRGLETTEFQLELVSGFSDEMQDKLLLSSLVDVENADRDIELMMTAWKTGNPAKMLELFTRTVAEHPDLKPVLQRLLDDRNLTMVEKIDAMLKQPGTYFIAVGSGHMPGDRGLIKLLQDRNYKVEQVKGQ